MPEVNRRRFLEQVIASQTRASDKRSPDAVYEKYASKSLPSFQRATTSVLDPYAGPWTDVQVRHLLRRTMFGVKDADVQTLLAMTMSDAVDYLLSNIPGLPAPPVNNYVAAGTTDITGVPAGQTWVTAPVGDGTLNDLRRYSYKSWWLGQMISQNLSIQEKMVFFWHNHFATQTYVVGDARYSYNHNVLLRTYALGNFQTLTRQITTDPAMLMYLNGAQNSLINPDENYARELQELFTVGKNNVPGYTEADVQAAAKVLTGWRINEAAVTSFFAEALHDTTDKQFSAFYNNTTINGQAGSNGATETDELIQMIFANGAAAHFLCTKLYRFFVYYNIDQDLDTNVVQPLAQLMTDNDYEVMPVLQCLLKSQHFYDPDNMGCYIKTPLDFIVGAFRTFGITLPAGATDASIYTIWNYLVDFGAQLGLDLGDPPNVAGWEPFYESPAFYEIWINSTTFPLRMEFTDMMVNGGFTAGTTIPVSVNVTGFVAGYPGAGDPNLLIAYLSTAFFGVAISATEQTNLKAILLSGQVDDSYWTAAWSAYVTNPTAENTSVVTSRLSNLLTTMLRLPEHQLC